MLLPLPNEIVSKIRDRDNSNNLTMQNLSLKYYKWADVYTDKNFKELKKDKVAFFDKFIALSKEKAYKDAYSIRKKHLEGTGISFPLTTVSRLLFGIGYDHPTEIGFMFDWTSGLPIIPGSSLKGIALDAAKNDPECCTDTERTEIFGSKNKGGNIIFFPAYPCMDDNKPFLEVDVMTPHYQPYYTNKDKPPADWYSPNPLFFLTVPKGIKYCFRLADRNNLKDSSSDLLGKAKDILMYALTEFGVGAKTSVFYGYFK